jgi:hypothetical protein
VNDLEKLIEDYLRGLFFNFKLRRDFSLVSDVDVRRVVVGIDNPLLVCDG